jgi:hypothetical protein
VNGVLKNGQWTSYGSSEPVNLSAVPNFNYKNCRNGSVLVIHIVEATNVDAPRLTLSCKTGRENLSIVCVSGNKFETFFGSQNYPKRS